MTNFYGKSGWWKKAMLKAGVTGDKLVTVGEARETMNRAVMNCEIHKARATIKASLRRRAVEKAGGKVA